MGLLNSKSNWLCSDCSGRLSTVDEVRSEFPPVPGITHTIIDYEITEFERCDENASESPVSYSNTGFSSKVTLTSPVTPTKLRAITVRRKVLSRNASTTSVNIVDTIRNHQEGNPN